MQQELTINKWKTILHRHAQRLWHSIICKSAGIGIGTQKKSSNASGLSIDSRRIESFIIKYEVWVNRESLQEQTVESDDAKKNNNKSRVSAETEPSCKALVVGSQLLMGIIGSYRIRLITKCWEWHESLSKMQQHKQTLSTQGNKQLETSKSTHKMRAIMLQADMLMNSVQQSQ